MQQNQIDDVIYFLKKGDLRSLQQAEILLNAEIQHSQQEQSDDKH